MYFPVNFAKFSGTLILPYICEQLLLIVSLQSNMTSKLPNDNANDTEPKRKFTGPIDSEVYDEILNRLNWCVTFFYRMMMILVCISVLYLER